MENNEQKLKKVLKKAVDIKKNSDLAIAREFVDLNDKIDEKIEEIGGKIEIISDELKKKLESELVLEIDREELKGDKGNKGDKGDKGDTTIVEKIVEKREIVKEQPIIYKNITNEIKEVAKYEDRKQIVDKINKGGKEKINASEITGLPEFTREVVREVGTFGQVETPLKAGTNISITTDSTGAKVISSSGGGGAVDSVNGQTGVVVLDADDISDATTTNKWTTTAEKTIWNAKFTLPSLTAGSVLLSDGSTIVQDNAALYFDSTNNRMGIGTNSLSTNALTIKASNSDAVVLFKRPDDSDIMYLSYGGGRAIWQAANSNQLEFNSAQTGGQPIINRLYSTSYFNVIDSGGFSFLTVYPAATGKVQLNADGQARDFQVSGDTDANLLFVDGSADKVGIGTATPSEKLNVVGNILATGTVLGSNLSGTNTGDQDLSGYLTSATAASTYQPLDTQLTSLAALTYAGNGGKFIRLNAGATDFEFATIAGGGDMVLASIQTVTGAKTFNDSTLILRDISDSFSATFTAGIGADHTYITPNKDGTFLLIDSTGLGDVNVDNLVLAGSNLTGSLGMNFFNGVNDLYKFRSFTSGYDAIFDTSLISGVDKTITIPNNDGTLALVSDIPAAVTQAQVLTWCLGS